MTDDEVREMQAVLVRELSDAAVDQVGADLGDEVRHRVDERAGSIADRCAIEKRVIARLILVGAQRLADAGIYDAGAIYALETLGFAMHRAGQVYPSLVGQTLQLIPRDAMPAGIGREPAPPMVARQWPWWRRAWRRLVGR